MNSDLPLTVGLPAEMKLGSLDFALPPDARSTSIKIQPSNISSVVSSSCSLVGGTASTGFEFQFPVQNLIFDLPCHGSPSTFIDPRFTTLNFRVNIAVGTALNAAPVGAYLRSSANAFFDRSYTVAQNGNILEDITEYGLINDTLLNLQMNNSVRDGVALQYGFLSATGIESQGHQFSQLSTNAAANANESHAYSVPLLNSLFGCTADKFFNIGRTSKLQLVMQTAPILPITIINNATALTAGTFTVTISDITLQCEYVDIGINALRMLDESLVNGKAYNKGTTYRTASVTIPSAVAGQQTLLAGVRGSSIKSLFARFYDGSAVSTAATGTVNGKYDSKNPNVNAINFNIAGTRYPQVPINPLLNPSQAFRETQMAIGAWNSTQFQSCIPPARYCILSAGGTASSGTTGAGTQDYYYSVGSDPTKLASFIFGENVEIIARRGVMSGLNATSAPIFLECNVSTANTNSHNVYVQAMMDVIYVHDVNSGDVQARL